MSVMTEMVERINNALDTEGIDGGCWSLLKFKTAAAALEAVRAVVTSATEAEWTDVEGRTIDDGCWSHHGAPGPELMEINLHTLHTPGGHVQVNVYEWVDDEEYFHAGETFTVSARAYVA